MRHKLIIQAFLFLFMLHSHSYAQYPGPGSNWYFGDYAGLTWNTLQANGDPMYLMDGALSTNEGVATISDAQGNLLFYSDGVHIWDSMHQIMSNTLATSTGGILLGDYSSTQSAVFIPKPLNANTYYIFTVDAQTGYGGFAYSRVDMTMNGGLGNVDVNEKNIILETPSTEKITAVKHANGLNFWVISHGWNTNIFYAYLVTSSGVQVGSSVISSVGTIHTGANTNTIGYMRASPDGSKVALAMRDLFQWEVFQFDNTTGQLSNAINLVSPTYYYAYGVEFSPDNNILYTGSVKDIYQWDLSSYNATAITSSIQMVSNNTCYISAIQLAPDQKLYVSRTGEPYMGCITDPNIYGLSCNYVDSAVLLGPTLNQANVCLLGLPTFVSSFFVSTDFSYFADCENDTVFFYTSNNPNIDSTSWNFDFPTTDPFYHLTSYTDINYFLYPSPGIYQVELISYSGTYCDTLYQTVAFSHSLVADLGPDQTLCADETLSYNLSYLDSFALDGSCDYFWTAALATQTFYDSSSSFLIDKPGLYVVSVWGDSICPGIVDTVLVEYNNTETSLGVDITNGLCLGTDLLTLDATYANTTYGQSEYTWNTGALSPSINVVQTGYYSVTVENGLCIDFDTIYVEFDNPIDTGALGPNRNLCSGALMTLDAGNTGANTQYAWSTGTSGQTQVVNSPGLYSVTISNACGAVVDELLLTSLDAPAVDLGPDITICEGIPETIGSSFANASYLWSTGNVTDQIAVYTAGLYAVTVTNECGSGDDMVFVSADQHLSNFDLGNDTAVCSGFVLDCGYQGLEYLWSNNETTQAISITQTNDYWVDVNNACGTFSDIIHIAVIELNVDLGGDQVLCSDSTLTLDALNPGEVYAWFDGSIDQTVEINQPGMVWVQVTNICETKADTINISQYNMTLDLGNDTSLCGPTVLTLDAEHPGATYQWSTGNTSQILIVTQSGLYAVSASHFCGDLNDEINVTINPSPVVDFGADTIYFDGNPVVLDPNAIATSYLWSNGATSPTLSVPLSEPGTYSVLATNQYDCSDEGSVVVAFQIGIDEVDIQSEIALFPNPAKDQLYISINDFAVKELRIFNSIGEQVFQIKNVAGNMEIDTQKLPDGIYFITVLSHRNSILAKPFMVVR